MDLKLGYAIKFVADMQKAVEFYSKNLGLKIKYQSDEWTEFETGQTTLALHIADEKNRPGAAQVGFETFGIDSAYESLKTNGVAFTKKPESLHGIKLAEFLDSEGAACSLSGK